MRLLPALAATLLMSSPLLAHAAGPDSQTASGHADILVKSDHSWNGVAYQHYPATPPQLTVLRLTIPPHTALPWHIHPVPNAGYVLAGQLTIQDRATGKEQTFHTGEAFTESVNDPHRGVSGNEQTVLILTYSGTKGTPTSVPLKGEKTEY
ncbi:cupin domain-containing protein [Gluconacetobacter tumulisoli]|uniref:Cupin domain-containing protein n=2 Tax=Gluconacetobacter tumulisoli TaxID=1286189 RepID=A0A7W4K4S4_9PROT|nr:cupin domain-containing protein [Gluconacetobacter tumulisoli]